MNIVAFWLTKPRLRHWTGTFAHSLLPTIGALGLQFVAFAVTARGLGVHQFGQYTAVLALAAVAVDVVGLGADDLLVRTVATQPTQFRAYWGQVLRTIGWSLPLATLITLGIAASLLRLALPWQLLALALFAEIAVSRILASAEAVMVGHTHTVRASWLRVGGVLVRLFSALLYFYVLDRNSLGGWIVVATIQALAVSVGCIALVSRMYGTPEISGVPSQLLPGLSFCATQVTRSLQSNMDRIILARIGGGVTLGNYGVASRFLQLGLFPTQVATRMLYPRFFAHGTTGPDTLWNFSVKAAAVMGAIGIASTLMVGFAAMLAPLVLGEAYRASVDLSWKLALSLPFIALQYPAADALTGAGRQSLRAMTSLVFTGMFGLVLTIVAWRWGTEGVPWGLVVGHMLIAVGYWLLSWRTVRPRTERSWIPSNLGQ